MKLQIEKSVTVLEEVDIKLPYYYRHCFDSEYSTSTTFGRIEENRTVTIDVRDEYGSDTKRFELEVEHCHASEHPCWFKPYYESSEEDFLKAKAQLLTAMSEI